MRILLAIFVFAGCARAQQSSSRDDPRALLLDTRAKVMQTVDRLPKYLCTEMVDRSTFQPEEKVNGRSCDDLAGRRKRNWKIRKNTSDRLRLDVAVSGDGEMYSWVGEDRFEDRSLDELVRSGATSTGTFASFLGSIFGTNDATFSYNGETKDGGLVLAEFGFRVPVAKSKYRIGSPLREDVVGYDGTFLVDPETLDLVRLTVHADQLPAGLNVCESTTTLNYGELHLNGSEFLIPKDAEWRVIYPDGTELENRTVFSGCHEFRGESTLRFDVPPPAAKVAAPQTTPRALALPPGLPFMVTFMEPIDTATAAAGDLVQARLVSPIRDRRGHILVPKNAAIKARIIRIERQFGDASVSLTLAVRLETLEKDGVFYPFDAMLESVVRRRQIPVNSMVVRQDLGTFDQMLDRENPGVGVLQFSDVTDDYVIHRNLEIEGRTAAKR